MTTDIVILTCDRLELLKRTAGHIKARTGTPYHLRLIDDASTEGNVDWAFSGAAPVPFALILPHIKRLGVAAALRELLAVTLSDPLVFVDDDVLCPALEPDWLSRGLAAMTEYPDLGILALNNPQCVPSNSRGAVTPGHPVSFCRNVGGTFCFIRRAVLQACPPPDGVQSAVKWLCIEAAAKGWRVGYLTDVYCQHIGTVSIRRGVDLTGELPFPKVDPVTLEPPSAYQG